jgi:hypothetical protein
MSCAVLIQAAGHAGACACCGCVSWDLQVGEAFHATLDCDGVNMQTCEGHLLLDYKHAVNHFQVGMQSADMAGITVSNKPEAQLATEWSQHVPGPH